MSLIFRQTDIFSNKNVESKSFFYEVDGFFREVRSAEIYE